MPTILEYSEDRNSPYAKNMYEFGLRVNAGDSAAILYESPYSDRYRLWLEKTKRIPRKEQTPEMLSGVNTEPIIFKWYETYKGIAGGSQAWGLHDDYPWIQAKADFWSGEKRLLAEFKAPTRDDSKDHEAAKRGEVAFHYKLQCLHSLEVFDVDEMDFVSWRSPDDFAVLVVKRDREFWESVMLPAYAEFWEAIQNDAYPKPDGVEHQASEQWRMEAQRVLQAKLMRTQADTYLSAAEAAMKRMATAKKTIGGGVVAQWIEVKKRYEVVTVCDTLEGAEQVLAALQGLKGKAVLRKPKKDEENPKIRSYPPSLWFKISKADEPE